MPLARPFLLFLCCIAIPTFLTFLSLLSAHPRRHAATESSPTTEKGGVRSFLSFHTPSSLFPPSAIISLTDDNSTFFLARPADFGPELVSKGLSGQLWVGSGFANDNSRKGGATSGAEGELGCSDIPGWEEKRNAQRGRLDDGQLGRLPKPVNGGAGGDGNVANVHVGTTSINADESLVEPSSNDGTDNHLHRLPDQRVTKRGHLDERRSNVEKVPVEHADIQSLQETAEITGKIALLSRGGCGFLEKVKWAQRRGASALIVGDDTRGGALVTMYARGDTSNISIPSLFTSHTTAHLLSSLIPPEGYSDEMADILDNVDPGQSIKAHNPTPHDVKMAMKAEDDRPNFTPSAPVPKMTTAGSSRIPARRKIPSSVGKRRETRSTKNNGWFKSLFTRDLPVDEASFSGDSRRPPSSGRLNWVNEPWSEELMAEKQLQKTSSEVGKNDLKRRGASKSSSPRSSGDGFEIGIQDWRDPDLVATRESPSTGKSGLKAKSAVPTASLTSSQKDQGTSKSPEEKALSGGSITPGSGEYRTPGHSVQMPKESSKDLASEQDDGYDGHGEGDEENWFSRVLWGDNSEDPEVREENIAQSSSQEHLQSAGRNMRPQQRKDSTGPLRTPDDEEHDGLWVTLTPTTMSTTPFFDTLLVLVVSPLITLTVVYSLLLIRSRMRRRRWRAPKSVVEQLPVRTYQTMSCSSTTSSTRLTSPYTSSPTSPLLQSTPRSAAPRPRPRSRTASGIENAVSASLNEATAKAAAKQEKPRRKYKGKQVECVVCLEEYIEGQSQVMSLPCGHEFHADCM